MCFACCPSMSSLCPAPPTTTPPTLQDEHSQSLADDGVVLSRRGSVGSMIHISPHGTHTAHHGSRPHYGNRALGRSSVGGVGPFGRNASKPLSRFSNRPLKRHSAAIATPFEKRSTNILAVGPSTGSMSALAGQAFFLEPGYQQEVQGTSSEVGVN
jgi:hypothetical protein